MHSRLKPRAPQRRGPGPYAKPWLRQMRASSLIPLLLVGCLGIQRIDRALIDTVLWGNDVLSLSLSLSYGATMSCLCAMTTHARAPLAIQGCHRQRPLERGAFSLVWSGSRLFCQQLRAIGQAVDGHAVG